MKPFLQEIAEYYMGRSRQLNLDDYCFIFPNKRSGTFFSHFLAEAARKNDVTMLQPEIITISDFVLEHTDTTEASRLEQLFILYHCYKKVVAEQTPPDSQPQIIDFNKFRFWGEILINDFVDVDKYMVNPSEIFHNIDSLKEISADYLTPEQVAVIERYWGADKMPPMVSEFWRHVTHSSKKNDQQGKRVATTSFIKLWQIMYPLYNEFKDELRRRGLSYQGMIYRDALAAIESCDRDDFPFDKYIFIGFNVLSTVEEKIFETLKQKRRADFFWDYVSPVFKDKDNRATTFLNDYVRRFPQPSDAPDLCEPITSFPKIEVIAVPSVMGQAKITAKKIDDMYPDGMYDQRDLLSTAIVLPDETLALPVIDSLPDHIKEINVTMGYPMRNTPVASLINSIRVMHMRARRLHGEITFFHEDVRSVLAHPLVRSAASITADAIIAAVNKRRIFNVPVSFFKNEDLLHVYPLFAEINSEENAENVLDFLDTLCNWLLSKVKKHYKVEKEEPELWQDPDIEEGELTLSSTGVIEAGFLYQYLAAIAELRRLRHEHRADLHVDLEEGTVFSLVERLVAGENVRFEGMPLNGLQVIGMLETRALDFENVIILSMNERVFPRKHFSKSFIPSSLRAAYGMSTIDHQESISAYYFYRLISRAEKVTLLYDSRTSGLSSGEPSRYINQLRYMYNPSNLEHITTSYQLTTRRDETISLKLTEPQKNKLRGFLDPASGRTLSASTINKFINCPVDFVLSVIEGYRDEDEVKDYFDEATYGTVVHEVLQNLYNSQKKSDAPLLVDKELIKILDNENVIMRFIVRSINDHYLKLGKDVDTPLIGDAAIMSKLILPLVRMLLRHELDGIQYFYFIGAEVDEKVTVEFPKGLKLNLRYIIDRLDYVRYDDGSEAYRIIDYKTGGDVVETKSVADLFDNGLKSRPKAMLQLMLYANALAQHKPEIGSEAIIIPQIFSFRTIASGSAPERLSIGGCKVNDYKDFNAEFMDMMEAKLMELFGQLDVAETVRFTATASEHSCKYCSFKPLCGVE